MTNGDIRVPIPFNFPYYTGREIAQVQAAMDSGQLHGDCGFTKKCHAILESRYATKKALLTHSCTGALEMAALLLHFQPGDEIILPSYTFVSTVNAFVLRGAVPVWCDIRTDTLNIDETKIEPLITPKTKAIVPVHYAGVACNMDAILNIADKHKLFVVEDAAQGVEAYYKGKPLGTIGHLGCYSFHNTKNYGCGEGGALLVNDEQFIERASIIREKGTNRSLFLMGQVDKYTWVDLGGSFLPSDLTAAFLLPQLEDAEIINEKRLTVWNRYYELLEPLSQKFGFRLPIIPNECKHNAHMFYLLCPSAESRTGLIRHLNTVKITATFHYVPLHSAPMGRKVQPNAFSLPVTDDLSARLVRLPMYAGLTVDQIQEVVRQIREFFEP